MLNPALAVKHAKTDENNQVRPVMTELWWGERQCVGNLSSVMS